MNSVCRTTKSNKLLSILCAALIAVALMWVNPVSASAATPSCNNTVEYPYLYKGYVRSSFGGNCFGTGMHKKVISGWLEVYYSGAYHYVSGTQKTYSSTSSAYMGTYSLAKICTNHTARPWQGVTNMKGYNTAGKLLVNRTIRTGSYKTVKLPC